MPSRAASPRISVIIPTRNRAPLLEISLNSLARQQLRRSEFEVVVVDDGSTDDTATVCERAAKGLKLLYVRIDASGISSAKNLGIFMSSAPLLLFFDDDDMAQSDLLTQHLATHQANPAKHVAVLGYTTWAPGLTVTPLMHYVMDVGGFLFCYGPLQHGQRLDFTYFWGGRSSCKRSLLTQHGIFNQSFTSIIEDIELGYRLTRFNLQVIHNREAVQFMNRPVNYEDFCARCERQGRVLCVFSRLHPDRVVQDYCQVNGVTERWASIEPRLDAAVDRVKHIEAALARPHTPRHYALLAELHDLYRFTFDAYKTRGIVAGLSPARAAVSATRLDVA